MSNDFTWKTKLAARIHDPAEKSLVLFRTGREGHEGGTTRALIEQLGLSTSLTKGAPPSQDKPKKWVLKDKLDPAIYRHVQQADWWGSAADRPQWPMTKRTVISKQGKAKTTSFAYWSVVRWSSTPVLIHPLTGQTTPYQDFKQIKVADIKQRSLKHHQELLLSHDGENKPSSPDLRKTLLALWRFGPELTITPSDSPEQARLWQEWKALPADTRIPDHSIWDHLDLVSAFAGAFAADTQGEATLLVLSLGPVQSFIAAARKTDDLWAGSHLLSRLSWEAMRPLCEALGPDAILFPRLRGLPQVDLWLRDQMKLPADWFQDCDWQQVGNDSNPLFSAALPNRFVAIVPASQAADLAKEAQAAARSWLQNLGSEVVQRLLKAADLETESATPLAQMAEQLKGFPEVHWAAVPFSLIRSGNPSRQTNLDTSALSAAMAPFFGVAEGEASGFLTTEAWRVLQKNIDWGDGTIFYQPNPGVLYPALFDLAERALAATKSTRHFEQRAEQGWRCSLTGEAEWLTTDKTQLSVPAGQRKSRRDPKFREGQHIETLWTRIADEKPAWAKKGEHLSALPAIKRLWPSIFAEQVAKALGRQDWPRFVVSTHSMALARQLALWLEKGGLTAAGLNLKGQECVALPPKFASDYKDHPALGDARRIPSLLDTARDNGNETAYQQAQAQVRQTLATGLADTSDTRLETYYALIMMDGDHMGRILSGDQRAPTAIPYRDSFHPQIQKKFDEYAAKQPRIHTYGGQRRPMSPNRHMAISAALNDFSQTVVPYVVEQEHLGRVIYSGGDDVLAMLPVAELLSMMQRLRDAYSGEGPDCDEDDKEGLRLHNGFAILKQAGQTLRQMRMMGERATASCGAVVAHHQAPLSAVMRELRAAEQRAKTEGGRNAFSITIIKRSGSSARLTGKWGETLRLLRQLINFLSQAGNSRRAVYLSLEWLKDIPDPKTHSEMAASLLGYQLARQSDNDPQSHHLAKQIATLLTMQSKDGLSWLRNFLTVAEFLAREIRSGEPS